MKISKIPGLGRFGIYIDNVDFNHITDDEWMEIGRLHLNSLVTIIRNCNMDYDSFPAYIKKFGPYRYSGTAYLQKKYNKTLQELQDAAFNNADFLEDREKNALIQGVKVSTKTKDGLFMGRVQDGFDRDGRPKGLFPEGELGWHSNESGVLSSAPGVALYGCRNMKGSATGFSTTVDYYESISDSMRSELDEMMVIHKYEGAAVPGLNDQFTHDNLVIASCPVDYSEVPMVIDSPGGQRGLHFSPGTVHSIKGMTQLESKKLFDELYKHLYSEKYTYDHWYQNNNDLLLFENSITAHRRIGSIKNRLAYRVAHDYTYLQKGAYLPYKLHPHIQRKYIKEIRENIKLTGIKNYKLPTTLDYLKTFI